jgi:hypothetical protein
MKSLPVLFVFVSCFAFYGCTHKDAVTLAPLVFDFSYSGSMKIQDTILFVSNAPATATFLWKFGDGTTSTQSTPDHVYTIAMNDTVSLIVNNDSAHPILKPIKLTANTGRVVGSWHWTRDSFGGLYPLDTTFPIEAVNDSAVRVWGEILPYNQHNAHANTFQTFFTMLFRKNDTLFFVTNYWGTSVRYHTP